MTSLRLVLVLIVIGAFETAQAIKGVTVPAGAWVGPGSRSAPASATCGPGR